jgi:1,4-dihydroxy-6-naphthoate synthase
MLIRLGHSPDSDDAFMFWGLASGAVRSDHQFEHILRDIQTLNEWAREGKLESTAVSVHAFAHLTDRYALLRHGASFGDNYGPMLVARSASADPSSSVIAVPGLLTSAYLALQLYLPGARCEVVPFNQIVPAVLDGRYDVGLIIHESQLTHKEEGLVLLRDMGEWWMEETGLPLPLGVNVVRRDLGPAVMAEVSRAMRQSIEAGLQNREAALDYALKFARGMDRSTADEFVGMYVNEMTRDMGERGLTAIRTFLSRGHAAGLIPSCDFEVVQD